MAAKKGRGKKSGFALHEYATVRRKAKKQTKKKGKRAKKSARTAKKKGQKGDKWTRSGFSMVALGKKNPSVLENAFDWYKKGVRLHGFAKLAKPHRKLTAKSTRKAIMSHGAQNTLVLNKFKNMIRARIASSTALLKQMQ